MARLLLGFILSCFPWCCWFSKNTVEPIKKNHIGETFDWQSFAVSQEALPRLFLGKNTSFSQEEGADCIHLQPNDITVDYMGNAHIKADAWETATIQKIKEYYPGQFSTIIFERIDSLPLHWSAYLQALCSQPNPTFYQFPSQVHTLVQSSYMQVKESRPLLYEVYKQNYGFYNDIKPVKLPTILPKEHLHATPLIIEPDPSLVTLAGTTDNCFYNQTPELVEAIQQEAPPENPVLKGYYDLLNPGGRLIFSSSASGLNRFGGLVVSYQGRNYTPFKDLDDPYMQEIYRRIFERAGFRDVQFYKDPYYMEEVILLTAHK